jgi:hypothetical protein
MTICLDATLLTGDCRYVKKALETGIFLHMAKLWKLEGASYTMHFDSQFKDGYSNEASLSFLSQRYLNTNTLINIQGVYDF